MKELSNQPKPQIPPLQRDLSLVVLSHLANGMLNKLDPNAPFVINNISTRAQFIFTNKGEAVETVVGSVAGTLDVFWGQNFTQNAKEQQIIDNLRLLKNQGISRTEIIERVSLHFRWGLNSQKI